MVKLSKFQTLSRETYVILVENYKFYHENKIETKIV